MFEHLRRNSQLRVLALLGLATVLSLAAFGLYRALQGNWIAASIDFGMVLLIGGPLAYALRTGSAVGPGIFACAANTLGCAAACYVIGPASLPWAYVVLTTNFFIAGPRQALACNLLLTLALLLIPQLFTQPIDRLSAVVAAAMITLFVYLFALRIKHDQQAMEELASLDILTGVPNRRAMELVLGKALVQHRGRHAHYGLVILDIDHFKEVNDTWGHSAGDDVLTDLASILVAQMRKQDRVFRFGGEEFVVLLKVDAEGELEAASERLHLALRDQLRGPGGPVTVSMGAALAGDEDRWQEWFSLADTALYRAKGNGRDSAVVAR